MIDPITEYMLYGDKQIISEGVLSVLNKAFVLLGFGSPADPRIKAIIKGHNLCQDACYKAYPDDIERTKTRSNKGQTDREVEEQKRETIETIKRNPDRGKCLVICHADKLKETIVVIKKNRKTICNKNMNRDLCEKWVDKYLPEMEANLKALENAIRMMKGARGDNSKVKVIVNTLKKIL